MNSNTFRTYNPKLGILLNFRLSRGSLSTHQGGDGRHQAYSPDKTKTEFLRPATTPQWRGLELFEFCRVNEKRDARNLTTPRLVRIEGIALRCLVCWRRSAL